MKITKFPVVLLLLAASVCRANIVAISRPNKHASQIAEDVVNIVTSCFGGRIEGIGVAGNLPDTLIRTLTVQHLIPVALIGHTYTLQDKREKVPIHFRHKLHVFILEASSFEQLDALIQMNIRYSIWWNHMASFFILDMSPGCEIGTEYLFLAWQLSLINAKVMCYHRKSGRIVLNYNPFISQAPRSWQRYEVFPGKNRHPFTVFSRKYRRDKAICVDLDFEKTKNLGGYVISIEGHAAKIRRVKGNRFYYYYCKTTDNVFDVFHDVLNATITYSNASRYPVPMGQDILDRYTVAGDRWDSALITYPHTHVDLVIVSQFRGYQSQFKKIVSVTNGGSLLGMGIVYFISLIFFKFLVRQALVPAFLNVIRLTSNTRFTNLPSNNATRIYLACLLLFATAMQGMYWSKLTSLLTINIPLPDFNTFQDFADFGYKFYFSDFIDGFTDHPVIKEHAIVYHNKKKCLMKVRDDQSAVYVGLAEGSAMDFVENFNLRVSKPVSLLYPTFNIRWDWPLEERINTILQKMVEGDVLDPCEAKSEQIKLTDFQYNEAVRNNQDFKKLDLYELSFAFGILGIGLACATVIFIIESAMPFNFIWGCDMIITRRRLNR